MKPIDTSEVREALNVTMKLKRVVDKRILSKAVFQSNVTWNTEIRNITYDTSGVSALVCDFNKEFFVMLSIEELSMSETSWGEYLETLKFDNKLNLEFISQTFRDREQLISLAMKRVREKIRALNIEFKNDIVIQSYEVNLNTVNFYITDGCDREDHPNIYMLEFSKLAMNEKSWSQYLGELRLRKLEG